MGVRKLLFPIALAVVWVVMAALAMVDFATFSATTRPSAKAVLERPLHSSINCSGRSRRLPECTSLSRIAG
jgi:hypothetical protein